MLTCHSDLSLITGNGKDNINTLLSHPNFPYKTSINIWYKKPVGRSNLHCIYSIDQTNDNKSVNLWSHIHSL